MQEQVGGESTRAAAGFKAVTVNKYFPFVLLFFFFNSVFLPIGVLYTTFLTPLFYIWLRSERVRHVLLKFIVPLLPFVVFHLWNGVHFKSYSQSVLLFFSTYIFTYALYILLSRTTYVARWFKKLTLLNGLFTLAGIIVIFTPYPRTLWTIQNLSPGVENVPRLSLLTYEPSFYSTLLVPLIVYFTIDSFMYRRKTSVGYLLLLLVSLALSFSLGVISGLLIALILTGLVFYKSLSLKKAFLRPLTILLSVGLLSFSTWFVLDTDNALVVRVKNVVSGKDLSGNGRTIEAFMLSYQIAQEKSLVWGAGLGQIKILGEHIIRPYYKYAKEDVPIVTIPCAAAETLAIFGFVGFAIRLLLQGYLFYKTRVLDSPFRTMIFLYIFIYQFTGSYIMNLAEYLLWVLAFTPCFLHLENTNHKKRPVGLEPIK